MSLKTITNKIYNHFTSLILFISLFIFYFSLHNKQKKILNPIHSPYGNRPSLNKKKKTLTTQLDKENERKKREEADLEHIRALQQRVREMAEGEQERAAAVQQDLDRKQHEVVSLFFVLVLWFCCFVLFLQKEMMNYFLNEKVRE